MSQLFVVAMRDVAAEAYGTPFTVPHRALAVRSFIDEVNRADPKNPMFTHAEDFELHLLAHWETETGLFQQRIECLARGRDVKKEV